MSAAIGGVIGGALTLVVVLGLLAVAWKTGHAAFGKANARRWREQATVLQDIHVSRRVGSRRDRRQAVMSKAELTRTVPRLPRARRRISTRRVPRSERKLTGLARAGC